MVEGVVVAVRVALCAAALLMETEAGETLQVAGLVAPVGALVTEQVRETVPVKELAGDTVMVEVLPLVEPGLTLILPLFESVKLLLLAGGGFQKLEQPDAKTIMIGAAAKMRRLHAPLFIAVPRFASPFTNRQTEQRPAQGSWLLLKDIACVLIRRNNDAHNRDANRDRCAHRSCERTRRHSGVG